MTVAHDILILPRDIDGLLIPSGARIHLQKGTEVVVTQELGNSFTLNVYGNLVRIDGKDADAIGKQPIVEDKLPDHASLEDCIWAQLRTCYDPEIPINIVDLGLIYDCEVLPLDKGVSKKVDKKEFRANIKMTLTAPGCGMGPVIADDVKRRIETLPTINHANIEIVFDPPWSQDMMSAAAKLQLGML